MSFYAFLPKLLNMSLTASIAIVCVLLLRLLLKKAPKVISYALWAVVLFRLLCPVSLSSNLSLFGLMDVPITNTAARTSSIEYVPEDIVHTEVPEVTIPVPGVSETINNALPEGREQLVADPLEAPVAIGTYVWLAGVLIMAGYSVASYVRLRRKLLIVSPLQGNIYLADEITTPFVMGLMRPKIYLPSDMEEGQQSYIILHEQHHIRRGDHIIKALAFLALSIHWFNPLVWVAFLYSNKDMEMSCDEAVVKKMGDGILADYTASLLSLATGKRIIAGMPLAFGEGDTKGRIRNLAHWKKPAFWVVLVAVIACIVLGIGLLTNPTREYQIRITIPAGSTAAFCYSDEEISPQRAVLTLANGDGLGDTEVILLPVEVQEENIYEPTYMTPGMPVKMDVEKGAWYKIGVNMQNPTTEDIDVYVSVKNVEIRISEKDDAGSENDVYGDIIAGLGDEDTYAFLVINYEYNVLLTSDLVYDEGTEKQAAIDCDVYYPVDGTAKKLGSILSDGTAYPITFTKDGIFAASGHKVEKYGISQEGNLYLEKGVYEQFDEAGNATYICRTGNQESEVTEQEYQALVNEYTKSQIVHFSYGAEGSVNEYQEKALDVETQDVMAPDMDEEGVYDELARVVSSVGLENAWPWNNTVNLKENADALIKMASDETGRFEIYGIMSAKYGTYGLLLNDWIGGQENWNFAYVP